MNIGSFIEIDKDIDDVSVIYNQEALMSSLDVYGIGVVTDIDTGQTYTIKGNPSVQKEFELEQITLH